MAGTDFAVRSDNSIHAHPAANFNGSTAVAVEARDSSGAVSNPVTFTLTVNAVNDAPGFVKGNDESVLEDAGPQVALGWATSISAGPSDESGQALNFIVSNDNNGLFSAQPAVSAAGDLTYTPAGNANGSSVVSVAIHDNGGTANGGVDTSAPQTFVIAVSAMNDPPVITLPGPTVNYTENDPPAILDATATVSDPDSPNFDGGVMTIEFSTGGTADDRLTVGHQGVAPAEVGVSGTTITFGGTSVGETSGGVGGSSPLMITFNVSATPAAAQAVLRRILFSNVSATPAEGLRTVRVTLNDGDGGVSAPAFKSVTVSPPNVVTALVLGAATSSVLSEAGEQDTYTFQGVPGMRLYYDALEGDFDAVNVRLYGPSGQNVHLNQNSDYDLGPFTLAEAGVYRLVLDANGALSADYKFRLIDVRAQQVLPLDTDVSVTLAPGFSAAIYRLAGTPGQFLYFDGLSAIGGSDWNWYGPNNESVSGSTMPNDFETTVSAPGEHVLVLRNQTASAASARFRVRTAALPTNVLSLGATTTGTLTEAGERHTFTFNGTPGQRLFYDALDADLDAIDVRLLSPSGQTVHLNQNTAYDVGPFTLTETGQYRLVVDAYGQTAGDYAFRVLDLSAAPSLTFGGPVSGVLNPKTEVDIFTFTGSPGQRVTLNSVSADSSDASWSLVNVNDQNLVLDDILRNIGEVVLPAAGLYAVIVHGDSAAGGPFNYQIQASTATDAPVTASGLGVVQTGTIASAGQTNSSTFDASAGTLVFFDSQDRSSTSLEVKLVDPTSGTVATFNAAYDAGPYVLARSGTHTIEVRVRAAPEPGHTNSGCWICPLSRL